MPSSSRKHNQIAFRCGNSDSESEQTSWDNEPRKEERFARIRARVPTGHPHLAKKLLQMQQELNSEEEEAAAAAAVSQQEEEGSSAEDEKRRKKSGKKSSSKKKSTKKPKRQDLSSSGEDYEPQVVVKTVKVSSSSKKKKQPQKPEEVHIGRATVIDEDGDSSWEEENRKQERFARIRKRVPTGHPGLAKKVEQLRAATQFAPESDDEEQIEIVVRTGTAAAVSSDEETEASPPKTKSRKSSKLKSSSKSKKTRKPKDSIQFGEAKIVDDSDNSWDERHRKEERYTRIRTRVPTGHPGLAKKVAQLRQQMLDDEESASSESEVETRKKTSKSKSKSVRV